MTRQPAFREDRVTQAAARLLELGGGEMFYLGLMKLLYLVDRRALLELGRPISFDRFASMPHGPVLSRTCDLMTQEQAPDSYWARFISAPYEYKVRLKAAAPPTSALSPAEEAIIASVHDEFGQWSRWKLVDYVHTLKEWHDPNGSSLPLPIKDILTAAGWSEEAARALELDLTGEAYLEYITA
jgi:uncharacterized phage-associated protein